MLRTDWSLYMHVLRLTVNPSQIPPMPGNLCLFP